MFKMAHDIRDIKNLDKFVKYGEAQVYIEDMQLDVFYECFQYLEPNINIDDIEQCNWHGYEQEFSICVHNYDDCGWDIYTVPAKVFDYWMEGDKDNAVDLYKKSVKHEKQVDHRHQK